MADAPVTNPVVGSFRHCQESPNCRMQALYSVTVPDHTEYYCATHLPAAKAPSNIFPQAPASDA